MVTTKLYEIVALPIRVPKTNFCFGGRVEDGPHVTCGHFNSDGGHPTCGMGLGFNFKYDKENRVSRPKACMDLKEI